MPLTQIKTSNIDDTGSGLNFRNRIINGDMRIDQRNGGASVTSPNSYQTVDRWKFYVASGGKFNAQQVADAPAGFTSSLKLTSSSSYTLGSNDFFSLVHAIEGYNITDLAFGTSSAKPVSISFWVKSSLTGVFGGNIGNRVRNRQYYFTYTIPTANTWTYISLAIPGDTTGTWDTNNTTGILLEFGLGAGSSTSVASGVWTTSGAYSVTGAVSLVSTNNATLQITGVQLEEGNAATAFERRPYGTELALCQRYLPVFSAPASSRFNAGYFYTSTVFYSNFVFQVPTRVTPTGIATTGSFNATYLSAQQATTPSWLGEASTTQAGVYGVVSGGVSAGIGMALAATSGGEVTIQFTGCEL